MVVAESVATFRCCYSFSEGAVKEKRRARKPHIDPTDYRSPLQIAQVRIFQNHHTYYVYPRCEFFVRYKDYLVPIEVKAGNNNSKSLSTLIKSSSYSEIQFGIKIVRANIGYESGICTFPHFCTFLIREFLSTFQFE